MDLRKLKTLIDLVESSGIAELVASALLLWPPAAAAGAVVALGVMTGAIVSHLTVLGIEVRGDGGLLFLLAVIVWAASAVVLWIHRASLAILGVRLVPGTAGEAR